MATALCLAATCALASCGPGVATPIPEPPTFKIGRIGPPAQLEVTATPDGGRRIHGESGAAPGGAQLQVTNLDRVDSAVFSNVRPDGSFDLNIVVNQGDELRFDWLRGTERGIPEDAHFVLDLDPGLFHFEPSERFACLKVTPVLALDFSAAAEQSLQVENECSFNVSFDSARTRLGSTEFSVKTQLPLAIPAQAAAELQVLFARTQPGAREDTLFLDVTGDTRVIRYPVTLAAPASQ